MSTTIRTKMTGALTSLWYLNTEITAELESLGFKPDTSEFSLAFREKLDRLSEDSFLMLYNQTLRKFYET